ncbi:uncharacterized protein prr14 [Pholidichthys leucotaenia]
MLTYPSDSLIQIVYPMDGDALPPNPFCSAPPPPFLSPSSVTPSCANDGISGHRRSCRIQGIQAQTPKKQDSQAIQKPPRHNPSPAKRQRESEIMVQASESKQLTAERRLLYEDPNKDGLDFSFVTHRQKKQKNQKSSQKDPNVSLGKNAVETFPKNTIETVVNTPKSDMGTCEKMAVGKPCESMSAPKGWVIGPLFQSLKSKMASFTEIVMSPSKLFRVSSPPPTVENPDRLGVSEPQVDDDPSEPSRTFYPEEQSGYRNQETEADQHREIEASGNEDVPKYLKKLEFDAEYSACSSGQPGGCAENQKEQHPPGLVPFPNTPCRDSESAVGSSFLLPSSAKVSASSKSRSRMSDVVEDHRVKPVTPSKPLSRIRTGNRSELRNVNSREDSDPEVGEKQLSLQKSDKSYISDSHRDDITMLLPSSVRQSGTHCLQPSEDDDDDNIQRCHLVQLSSLSSNLRDSTNKRILKSTGSGFGREKTELKVDRQLQESVKRKRMIVSSASDNTTQQELRSGKIRELRPVRKEAILMQPITEREESLISVRKTSAVSMRANGKGKVGQQMLPTIKEPSMVCSVDKGSSMAGCSSRMSPVIYCKRLKISALNKSDVTNINTSMDLETTLAITSAVPAEEEQLSEVLVRPCIKQLQSTSRTRNTNKTLKRRLPEQANQVTESDRTLVSTSSLLPSEPFQLTSTDLNTSKDVHQQEMVTPKLNQPSKKPKKGLRGAVQSPEAKRHLISKESRSNEDKAIISVDPVDFETMPFNCQSSLLSSHLTLDCFFQVNSRDRFVTNRKAKSGSSVGEEMFPTDSDGNNSSTSLWRLRSSTKRGNIMPRRDDNQRRKSRVLGGRMCKGEEVKKSITVEDADLSTSGVHPSETCLMRCLMRSYSCPEIHSLQPHDSPWTSPHHSRTRASHHVTHSHKHTRRARRHTVCSVEVEREIAPLCLRKEVYPSRKSGASQHITQHPSPSSSISALASCFLSSPLAFLSKKFDSRGAATSSTTTCASSPSSSSSSVLTSSSSSWSLPGFMSRNESSGTSFESSIGGNLLECEDQQKRQTEENDDGDTSSSSQEFEDACLQEEKALSDSEIKVVQKHKEQGKVSSIRIRKTLPKPQNNLTPMGLPKPIRVKKKEFSLEEIYTNKNFSKPPESRLETIFEVPLNRRNGSESWFGQRRVKRFLEFLEVGETRKPKKPLVGVGKAGNSSSRTRRGGFLKDEPSLSVQDVDSLLCAKLDQLNLWLIHDQRD